MWPWSPLHLLTPHVSFLLPPLFPRPPFQSHLASSNHPTGQSLPTKPPSSSLLHPTPQNKQNNFKINHPSRNKPKIHQPRLIPKTLPSLWATTAALWNPPPRSRSRVRALLGSQNTRLLEKRRTTATSGAVFRGSDLVPCRTVFQNWHSSLTGFQKHLLIPHLHQDIHAHPENILCKIRSLNI